MDNLNTTQNWHQSNISLKEGRYIIKALISNNSGTAVVYLAKDTQQNVFVAIKILRDDVLENYGLPIDNIISDFNNEVIKLHKAKHPNIVEIKDTFEVEIKIGDYQRKLTCIVLEYIEGKTLEQLIGCSKGGLEENEALDYIKKVGKALTYIHVELNTIHRDIKPGNIVVRATNNQPVLIDFALARDFIINTRLPHTVQYTKPYAPPEQYHITAERGSFTDIYSLAATLYHLLTGEEPPDAHQRESESDTTGSNFLDKLPPNINQCVKRAIVHGMQLNYKKRPQTVQGWLQLLEPESIDDLSSDRGIDYTNLRNLLLDRKWKEADEETINVMIQATGREREGHFGFEAISNFPCTDLCTIDRLWCKYSDLCFGFSVQKDIWLKVNDDLRNDGSNGTEFLRFRKRIDWFGFSEQFWDWQPPWDYESDDEISFYQQLTPGHLPWMWLRYWGMISQGWGLCTLLHRVQTCGL